MARKKKNLSYEDLIKKEKEELERLKKQAELEKLRYEKKKLEKEIRGYKIKRYKETFRSIGRALNVAFSGVPALGPDLKPIDTRKKRS